MLLTFIKLPFVIKIFVLSIFEWSLKTGITVYLISSLFGCIIPFINLMVDSMDPGQMASETS